MALFGKQGRDLGPAPNLSIAELQQIMAGGQANSDALSAQGEPSQINFWSGMQPQYQAILDYMNQNGLTNTSQVPEAYKRFLVPQKQAKTFGDQAADYITNPAVLTALGGVAGVYAGGASAAGAGSGSTGGATVGGLTAAEEASLLGGASVSGGSASGAAAGGTAAGGAVGGGGGVLGGSTSGASTGAGMSGSLNAKDWASLVGAGLGALSSSNNDKSATSTSTSVPWSALHPYLGDLFNRAQGASLDPSDLTQAGDSMAINRAMQGSPLNSAAQNSLLATLRGDYLDPGTNPAWGPMSQRITDAYQTGTAAQTDAAFNRAGTFGLGNSAYEQQVGRNQQGLGDSLSMLAGNLYGQERQNQMQGINIAPFTAEAQYADADRLRALGEQRSWGPLFNYQQLLSGQGGGTTTNSQPLYSNPINGALGGALLGNQLFGGQQQGGANQNWATQGSSTPFFGDYGWGNV